MRLNTVLITSVLVASACTDTPGSPPAPWTETDSAGVLVIENRFDAIPRGAWAVGPTPTLSIGGLDAGEEQQLFQVDGATRLPDGRLAVASSGTYDVRVFDSEGALLARYGAEGDGPDEFRGAALVGRYGTDTLVVFDATLSRVSLIHPVDGFVGSAPVEWSGKGFPVGRGLLGDGSILIGGGMSFSSSEGFPTGVIRPLSTYGWIGRDGTQGHVLGDYPAAEMFARANEQGFMARGLPFARVTSAAAAPGGVWLGTAESWEISFHGTDGRLRRLVRTDRARRPVTEADRRAHVEAEVADATTENEARQIRGLLEEMPGADVFPPYRSFLVDALGYLWVEDYLGANEDVPRWTVFDARGRAVARLETPGRTRVLEIGADYLLGRTLDELDVESLTLWDLTRSN
jgi:hypothetical protein